jgi:hypothetical protein
MPPHRSDPATAPAVGSSAYEDWSPAASWRAAEERTRATGPRLPRIPQGVQRPTVQLPRVSNRALRYAACGLALLAAGLFLLRAFDSKGAPGHGHQKLESKTFAWVPVSGARAYRVVFKQDGRVIYASRTRSPRLTLHARWAYRGHRHALYPGVYQWYVWPIHRTAKGSHRGPAAVDSTLTIPD